MVSYAHILMIITGYFHLPAFSDRHIDLQQAAFIIFRILFPLIRRHAQYIAEIPVQRRDGLKPALHRNRCHRLIAASHQLTGMDDADHVQILARRNAEDRKSVV